MGSLRFGRPALRILALLFLLAVPACRRGEPIAPAAPVIVLSVDTLRADRLPVYGYRLVDTPNLDVLARDSMVFDNALAHVPLTLPSHASLFTGLLPFEHGVRDNVGYRLAETRTTLASFLRDRGFATGGAVSSIVLDQTTGIAAGFDFYEDEVEAETIGQPVGHIQRSGWQTEKLLEAWIEKLPPQEPLFAFLHLFEPHAPYDPPEPFASRYAGARYDGEIAAADAVLGRFLGFLREEGIYDRALIVFLSDHGEGLGEHAEDEHGIFLYRQTIRVPLFVKLPGSRRAGMRVDAPVGLADVFPTVAAVLGGKAPQGLSGISLLELAGRKSPERRIYAETLYPRFHFGWSDLASLSDGRYQYIEAPRPELYDWRSDPAQKKDLSPHLSPAFRALRAALAALERPIDPPGERDPEKLRKLASLGYIGAASPRPGQSLPDPKDRIRDLDLLKRATRLATAHRSEEAVAMLRGLAEKNPLMLDVWETLTWVLRASGRPKEALEALHHADRLSPGTPQILLGLANLYLESGDPERARSLTEAARAVDASNVPEMLAAIALHEGKVETARARALEALSASPDARRPRLLLARIEQRGGNLPAALGHIDRALTVEREWRQPPLLELQATRGDLLAHMGREKEAEEAFRAEVGSFPENLQAWSRLALLYASAGRAEDFRLLLDEMTARVPTAASFEAAARVSEIVGKEAQARDWRKRKQDRFR